MKKEKNLKKLFDYLNKKSSEDEADEPKTSNCFQSFIKESNLSKTQSTSSLELCEKIKNITEDIKEKIIKKTNCSPYFISKNKSKKNEKNSEDFEENSRNKCITRIKIDANDNMEFFENNSDHNDIPESRSPFINRALPPLPSSQSFSKNNINGFNSNHRSKKSSNLNNEKIKKNYLPKKNLYPPPHLRRRERIQYDDRLNGLIFNHEENIDTDDDDFVINDDDLNYALKLKLNSTVNQIIDKNDTSDTSKSFLKDYASSIEKVKDKGWYWGPISGEKAEKLLENEPEGSFILRDSKDENYIFSLSFKLDNDIIHVRIEHYNGKFSFGQLHGFKCSNVVDFINEIVEYSRSGKYLFFVHRVPIFGPIRVKLLYPVTRFRKVQSLKHLCRFLILKHVRRDYICSLPLPDKLIRYLKSTNYYLEESSI